MAKKKGDPEIICSGCSRVFLLSVMKKEIRGLEYWYYCEHCWPRRHQPRAIQQIGHIAERGRRIAEAQSLSKVASLFRQILIETQPAELEDVYK